MKICSACNSEVSDDMQFCGKCGASVAQPAQPKKICPKCGNELDEELIFCDKCGTKLPVATESTAVPAPEPPIKPQPAPPPISPAQTYPLPVPPPTPPITVKTQVKQEKRHVVVLLIFAIIAIGCAIAGAWLVSEESTYNYDGLKRIDESMIYGGIVLMAIGIVIGITMDFVAIIRKRKSIRKASVITIIIFCVIAVTGGIVGAFLIANSYYYSSSLGEWRMVWAQLQFGFIFMTGGAIITALTGFIANITKKKE